METVFIDLYICKCAMVISKLSYPVILLYK